jgi:uncharacterized protein with HEPN domain
MARPSPVPRLTDIIEAIELILSEMAGITLDVFEPDRRERWLVERGIEIISEASRRLPDALKARHANIPWPKVAGIGNVCAMITNTLHRCALARGARRAAIVGKGLPRGTRSGIRPRATETLNSFTRTWPHPLYLLAIPKRGPRFSNRSPTDRRAGLMTCYPPDKAITSSR